MTLPPMAAEPVTERLRSYYTRYYRDTLGIPTWADLVSVRIREEEQELHHLKRLESLLRSPVAGKQLLNVGCGTGGFNVVAERAGAVTWGVDSDPEALAICRLKSAHEQARRFILAVAEALPFRSESFDLVYCFSALEHVLDEARAVAEMIRVVRPGGAVYLHAPNAWACYEGHYKIFWPPRCPRLISRVYLALRRRPTVFLGSLRSLTPGRCRRLFQAAGARVELFSQGAPQRESGGRLWPVVSAYYRLFGIEPSIELLAWKTASPGF